MPKKKTRTTNPVAGSRHFVINPAAGGGWHVVATGGGVAGSTGHYKTERAALSAVRTSQGEWYKAGYTTNVKLCDAGGHLVEWRTDHSDGTHTIHPVAPATKAKTTKATKAPKPKAAKKPKAHKAPKAKKTTASKKGGKTGGWHAFQNFAKEKRAAGMSEADIGAAWAKHKAGGTTAKPKHKKAPKAKTTASKSKTSKAKKKTTAPAKKKTTAPASLPHGHVVALPPMATPDGRVLTPKGPFKGGHKKAKTSKPAKAPKAAKAKTPKAPKAPRKKSAWDTFRTKRMKELMATGMKASDAMKKAGVEWSAKKK